MKVKSTFICLLSNASLLPSQVIDANENLRFIKKKLKGYNSNPL